MQSMFFIKAFAVILLLLISDMLCVGGRTSVEKNVCDKHDTEWGQIREGHCDSGTKPKQSIVDNPLISGDEKVEDVDIAIVGGGLVGLSLAIGLTRGGISCRVYERAPRLRSVSQGILAIKPIGMQALEDIHPDIPTKVAEVGCERLIYVLTKVDAEGNVDETVDEHLGRDDEAMYGRKRIGITWHNMQQVLASMLPLNAVKTGRSLSSFEEGDESVMLRFDDGTLVRCQSALMCDGVFSVARKQMFPDDRAIYFGQLNWGSVIKTDSLPHSMHPPNAVRYITYSGEPKWMAMLNDGGGGYTFFQLRISDSEKALALSGNHGRGGLGLSGVIQRLLQVVKSHRDVSLTLESIPESQLFERSIVGRSPLTTWLSHRKRVVLVGDSAHSMHPNIGQGANTGFESSHELIKAMIECDGNWKSAFISYEKEHKARADLIQAFANLMGCSQSQQKDLLPNEAVSQMYKWINSKDPTDLPSDGILDIIKQFNPLSQRGVSSIS